MPHLGDRSKGPRGEQHWLGKAWLEMAKAVESQGLGEEAFPCLCVELTWVLRG